MSQVRHRPIFFTGRRRERSGEVRISENLPTGRNQLLGFHGGDFAPAGRHDDDAGFEREIGSLNQELFGKCAAIGEYKPANPIRRQYPGIDGSRLEIRG